MADDSFRHDEGRFKRRRAPSGVDFDSGEVKYAQLVGEVIWEGKITAEGRQRLQTAREVYDVPTERAEEIEQSLIESFQARAKIEVVEEDAFDPLDDATTLVDDRALLAPLAEAIDPRLLTLQRRIRALERRNGEMRAENREQAHLIERLENLVEQLQTALETTLQDLDEVSQRLDEEENAKAKRRELEPPPHSVPARYQASRAEASGEVPMGEGWDAPPPVISHTQAVGTHDAQAEDSWAENPVAVVRQRRDNPTEIYGRLRNDPRNGQLLHQLFTALGRDADHDRRWCVAHALCFLEEATDEERELYESHRRDGLIRPARAVHDAEWLQLLYHPWEDPVVGEILSVVAPAVLLGKLTQVRASIAPELLDPSTRVDTKTSTAPAVKSVTWAADVLGIMTPTVHLCPDDDVAMDVVLNPTPVSRLGKQVLGDRSPAELAFRAGRHLTWFRREHLLGQPNRSMRRLEDMFLAALLLGNPGLPITDEVKARVEPMSAAIRPMVGPEGIEQLKKAFGAFVEAGGRTNLSKWYLGVERTSCAAGLLLCDDLAVAADVLRQAGVDNLPIAIDELILYATGDRFGQLRKRIGVAVEA